MLKRDVQVVSGQEGWAAKTVMLPKVFKWQSKDWGDDKSQPYTIHHAPYTIHHKPQTLNPKP